jgi:adenosylcobinamide kinase/adenosylcobinamide-phosphate guanylyltransferase
VWGVGRSESQETCPDAGIPTGLRGRTRVTAFYCSELILGGARSGKSQRALTLGRQSRGATAFVATAQGLDGDMRARIARHRAERPRAWTTVEEAFDVVAACRRLAAHHDLAIVDCLTLWVSNRLLRGDGDEAIVAGGEALAKFMAERLLTLIIVSNEVGEGVHPPTDVGLRFRDLLGSINQKVAAAADRVTLMVAGLPLTIKDAPASRDETIARGRPPEAP